jgi:hypothetical protein
MARDVTPSAALRCAVSQAPSVGPGASKAKGAAMTGDQENAESGKALFDLISDLSAGYRTNAVLTAGLHLAASALVLGSDSLEQAEQQAEMSGERFIAAVRTIWSLKYQDDGRRH